MQQDLQIPLIMLCLGVTNRHLGRTLFSGKTNTSTHTLRIELYKSVSLNLTGTYISSGFIEDLMQRDTDHEIIVQRLQPGGGGGAHSIPIDNFIC